MKEAVMFRWLGQWWPGIVYNVAADELTVRFAHTIKNLREYFQFLFGTVISLCIIYVSMYGPLPMIVFTSVLFFINCRCKFPLTGRLGCDIFSISAPELYRLEVA